MDLFPCRDPRSGSCMVSYFQHCRAKVPSLGHLATPADLQLLGSFGEPWILNRKPVEITTKKFPKEPAPWQAEEILEYAGQGGLLVIG